jgi:hypothetical protein
MENNKWCPNVVINKGVILLGGTYCVLAWFPTCWAHFPMLICVLECLD